MMPLDSAPLILGFCVLILAPNTASALSCPPCDRKVACTSSRLPVKCAYGRVLDACGCCTLCGNGPGEPCGGEFLMLGVCGKGLECRSNHATDVPEFAEGVCVYTKPWLLRMYKTQPHNKKQQGVHRISKPIKIQNKAELQASNKLPPGLKLLTPQHPPQPSVQPKLKRRPLKNI